MEALFPRQAVLGCTRKLAEHVTVRQSANNVLLPWVLHELFLFELLHLFHSRMDSNLFAEIRGHELERECKDTEIILEEDEMDKIKQNGGKIETTQHHT